MTDLLRDLYRRDDMVMVCYRRNAEFYAKFVEEHYGVKVGFQRVPVFPEQLPFQVFKPVEVTPEKGESAK